MSGRAIFLTHAEVVIDPKVPVPDWGLSPTGAARHAGFAKDPAIHGVRAIYSSTERKARQAAAIVGSSLDLSVNEREDLGENDRSSTGFLPEQEFWPVVEAFFAEPDASVRGWESARGAQTRIRQAAQAVMDDAPEGDVLIAAHGGVGTLLRCNLMGIEITKSQSQPHAGGGCWFAFDRALTGAPTDWKAI